MPVHQIHGALTHMYWEAECAPWTYPEWKEITSVKFGLFPPEDENLPSDWTRADANAIQSYFVQYKAQPPGQKIRFASMTGSGSTIPGRVLWKKFVTKGWKDWRIHARITKILMDHNLHPYLLLRHSTSGAWPDAARYIPIVLPYIALDLFGPGALDGLDHPKSDIDPMLHALVTRTWSNLNNQRSRSVNQLKKRKAEALAAFADLDRDKLTKRKIDAVITKVARWKTLAEIVSPVESEELIEEMDGELRTLLSGLGADLVGGKKRKVLPSLSSQLTLEALKSLASRENVTNTFARYDDFLCNVTHDDTEDLSMQHPAIDVRFGQEGVDPGVEFESQLSRVSLLHNLGFKNGRPLMFNAIRHQNGLNPWDSPFPEAIDGIVPNTVPLNLHWHQLAAIHAILRNNFTKNPNPDAACGILITDEVGLGKTFQATGLMAHISELVQRQQKGEVLPPIIAENPYLGTRQQLPNLPHLIICPGTLQCQWEHESKVTAVPKSFDILVYGSGRDLHQQFWAPDGPFESSKHPPYHRIIIASHASLLQDFDFLYAAPQLHSKGSLPWEVPRRLPGFDNKVKSTLFHQSYLVTTVDEAHEYRNPGPKHVAALAILKQSTLRVIMTATPLQTSTKDLAAMGRLVGIPHFLSELALTEEKADANKIRSVKGNGQDDDKPVRDCLEEISARMNNQFGNHIIRRGASSKDWEGKPLISLPPCRSIQVNLQLSQWESDIMEQLEDGVIDTASAGNSVRKTSRNFYLEMRLGAGYARLDTQDPLPKFKTLEEWHRQKSTKMDACARICQHLLSRDDASDPIIENGKITFPPLPPLQPGEVPKQTHKILVYQEFPSLGPLLRNVLNLYGVKHLYIEGRQTLEQRAAIVERFRTDDNYRVLIFSKIGTVGLNLSRACILIFFDQPWSAQDETQIRGRLHRQPQKLEVKCYHLLALDTADVLLAGLAEGKKGMMEAFLRKDRGKSKSYPFRRPIVSEQITRSTSYDPTVKKEKAETKSKSKPKAVTKVRKTKQPKEKSGEVGGSDPAPKAKKQTSSRKKPPKSDPIVVDDDNDGGAPQHSQANSEVDADGAMSAEGPPMTEPETDGDATGTGGNTTDYSEHRKSVVLSP
ncbi:hypothetical protein BDN72DRAFT_779739 [Pluteus cervinus]|uniref:Uncharacterized protein n=1 Tax=Pluteus cervinus TaxID=181527 RepID=A0ACD3A452_9AGAR|nr:hypothetical protein BDN72DRAFT_779739 [Pluteus cervinus]